MENNGFEGGEAVLLSARCITSEGYHGGGRMQRGDRKEAEVIIEPVGHGKRGGCHEGGGQGDVGHMGSGSGYKVVSHVVNHPPPVTHTNGGPPCHCAPDENHSGPLPPKEQSLPLPVFAQESPWHRHKSIFLSIIIITLLLWIIVYTVISQMDLA